LIGTIPSELGSLHSLEKIDIGKLLQQIYHLNQYKQGTVLLDTYKIQM